MSNNISSFMLKHIEHMRQTMSQEEIDEIPSYIGSIKPVGEEIHIYTSNGWVELEEANKVVFKIEVS